VSVGGQPKYTEGFAPLPASIHHVPLNDIEALRAAFDDSICAFVIEPVQGEGGVTPATQAYLQMARDLCDEFGALLIFDEVQCGVGRSGYFYAYEAYGIVPDILTTAKGLGGGFPIGAMLTRHDLAAHFVPGTHGTTFGGNPLAAAVALTAVSIINTPEVLDGVKQRGQRLRDGLMAIHKKYGIFKEVRGMGLLLGAALADGYADHAKTLVHLAQNHGLMILNAGPSVLRFAPSLIIDFDTLDQGLALLDQAVADFIQQSKPLS
jgi:acetylornithine/succinyldiaminopimelate/putrescine aminotransferase